MNMICDNCGRKFEDAGKFERVFPNIPDLLRRIEPGGTVPCAECPNCGALVYMEEITELACTICGEPVDSDRLREHLGEHNPNALNMDWEDVRNVFRVPKEKEEPNDELRTLTCPSCHTEGQIAQHKI